MRKSVIVGGIASLAIVAGTAMPAFASGSPSASVAASATVNSTLTITGTISPLNYGPVDPATPKVLANAEVPTVQTNSPGGAELTLDGSAGWSPSGGGASVAGGNVTTVKDNGTSTMFPLGPNPVVVGNSGVAGVKAYPEDFTVNFPAATPPGSFVTTYLYTAIAN